MAGKELIKQYKEGRRDFSGVNLYGADLTRAYLYRANLEGASLIKAKGLDLS